MLLRVKHKTTYQYNQPQNMIVQSHRLYPSNSNAQSVKTWKVDVPGAVTSEYFTDGAGDRIRTISVMKAAQSIQVTVQGSVITHNCNGVTSIKNDRIPPEAYLVSSKLTKADDALKKLAKQSLHGTGNNTLDQAHKLMQSVHDTIAYVPGSTTSEHTAAQVLELGHGVCQDQTHCLVSIARINHIPARYVTGYFYDPQRSDSHGESHAWAELYIQELGWVGFDATNLCCPDERYIRIGGGLDSVDAALIRGVVHGDGIEQLQTVVQVEQAQQ